MSSLMTALKRGDFRVEQIGEARYMWVTTGGSRHVLIMTRGLGASDKWAGEWDGVIYVQR